MLGSVADTEDVLQESWLAWHRRATAADAEPVEHPRSYLVRVAVNAALARQDTIRRRRESYLGTWLPEPLLEEPAEDTDTHGGEALSLALLVVLETLSPLERAVFVLHEAFGFRHTEVAEILGRSPDATRQLAHRARSHVRARRPRFRTEPRVHQEVTERFVAAALGGDLGALIEMLAPDATITVDGAGTPGAPRRPVRGRERVARLVTGLAGRGSAREVHFQKVNDEPAAVVFSGDTVMGVMVLDLAPGGQQVRGIYAVFSPDKLAHLRSDATSVRKETP